MCFDICISSFVKANHISCLFFYRYVCIFLVDLKVLYIFSNSPVRYQELMIPGNAWSFSSSTHQNCLIKRKKNPLMGTWWKNVKKRNLIWRYFISAIFNILSLICHIVVIESETLKLMAVQIGRASCRERV